MFISKYEPKIRKLLEILILLRKLSNFSELLVDLY
jgi:hypothetical protein